MTDRTISDSDASDTDAIETNAIEGIASITYSSDGTQKNWDDMRRFFADWGLKAPTRPAACGLCKSPP